MGHQPRQHKGAQVNDILYADGRPIGVTASEAPFEEREAQWNRMVNEANNFLGEVIGVDARIDEVALMFDGKWAAQGFIANAVMEAGVSHFNAALDFVHTSPIPSSYAVRYDFLQKVGSAYRVECMSLLEGVSPLHAAYQLAVEDRPLTIHLSFKVPNEQAYESVCKRLFEDAKLPLAQSCKSTYGRFSYWPMPLRDGTSIFLKPRVNTRDSSMRTGSSAVEGSLVVPR